MLADWAVVAWMQQGLNKTPLRNIFIKMPVEQNCINYRQFLVSKTRRLGPAIWRYSYEN